MNILVIDIGSSSVRALVFDEALRIIVSASRPYQFTTQPPGAAVVDVVFLRGLVESCLDDVLASSKTGPIRAVGTAALVSNLLGVDASGQPVTPVYTYADMRGAEDVAVLREKIDVAAAHERTGCPLHSTYYPPKLAWIYRTGQADKVVQWLDFATYLYRVWFGRAVPCSYSVMSWSGMLNRATLSWDTDWLNALNLSESQFSPLADYSTAQMGLRPDYGVRWSALREAPFFLAVGDGGAANVGSGAVSRGLMALTIGTTSALRMISDDPLPPVPEGLWAYRVDAKHHLIGGAAEGGYVFQWLRQTLQLPADIDRELLKREPDSHGLTFLPMLAGERAPGWMPDATASITGLRMSTTPLDMVQAGMESISLRLSIIKDRLKTAPEAVYGGGGALTASRAWAQMLADTLNTPLHILAESETSARGVAMLARYALGEGRLSDFPPDIAAVIEPRPAYVPRMQAARERQMQFYHAYRQWAENLSSH